MGQRIPDQLRADIADAIRAGGTCRGLAAQFGVSTATIRNIAAEQGIVGAFSRTQTENATRARVADLAERRAGLAERMLTLAEHIADRATTRYEVIIATKDEVFHEWLDEPPLGEVRQAMTAVGIAIDKHMALIKFDTKEIGNAAAQSLADNLVKLLGLGEQPDDYDDGYIADDVITDPAAPDPS